MRRGGHEGDIFANVFVVVEERTVKTLLLQGYNGFVETVLKLGLDGFLLFVQRIPKAIIGDRFPVVKTVNLAGD